MVVVVDDEDDRRFRSAGCFGRVLSVRMRCGLRYWEEALDDLCQILQLHWLVELHTVMASDIAQGVGRDITGQNDDRDLAMKLFPQLRDDLEPVHTVWQIVVCKDEVRSDRPARDQFQRCDTVRRCYRAMALVLEGERRGIRARRDRPRRPGSRQCGERLQLPRHLCPADGAQVAVPFRSVRA